METKAAQALHFISPNMHIIMVHFPLGIFVFGLFLELFSFLWRRSTIRVAAQWMILIGGLLAIPAALSGMDAFHEVNDASRHQVKVEGVRMTIRGITDQQWAMLSKHILWTSIGAGVAAIGVTLGLALVDVWRRRLWLYLLLLLVLCGSAGLLVFGSHFGGEGIYLEGLATKLTGTPAEGFEWWVPSRATHVLVAGLAMAVAMGALGASLRRLFLFHAVRRDVEAEEELSALTAPATSTIDPATGTVTTTTVVDPAAPAAPVVPPVVTSRRVTDDLTVARTLNADAALLGPRFAAGRFWFLSAVLFLIALGFGVWFLISLQDKANFDMAHVSASTISHEVWQTATETKQLGQNRRGFHIGLGIALVILPLLLAISVRFMIRMKWLVVTLCLLTFLCIAAEIWLGALLSYRGHEGPIYKFPPAPTDNPNSNTAMVLPHFG